ncbi:MAG TPA: hypothetical protein VK020_05320, partial [Microlunatus sp.]|nr:hypothetical protein [Microlunatus sp.]
MSDTTDTRVAEPQTTVPAATESGTVVRSLWSDAWRELRRNPIFWISAVLIVLILLMAIVPQLFTQTDPNYADLNRSREAPSF